MKSTADTRVENLSNAHIITATNRQLKEPAMIIAALIVLASVLTMALRKFSHK